MNMVLALFIFISISYGEMYRGDMVAYFAEHISGFSESGLVRSYGNRFYKKPIIQQRIRWTKPVTVGWWKQAQAATKRPIKGMLTGPYTIMDWSFNEFYEDRAAACMALAIEIRKEVKALIEAGAKIIQIDEPALSVRPDELQLAIDAMDVVTRDLNAYFITHVCYGDFEKIYPAMLKMPVDNFDLEMANSNYDLLKLFQKYPFTKDITLGVVDVHRHQLENFDEVVAGIRNTLKIIPIEQVWIDPDCGLKTRSTEEAMAKLKLCVDASKALRASSR
jgi:5-methyltetrahydropteroyltriglutamate--homocysteine methyltransferase